MQLHFLFMVHAASRVLSIISIDRIVMTISSYLLITIQNEDWKMNVFISKITWLIAVNVEYSS